MEKEANPPTLGVAKQTELLGGGLPPPYPPPLGHPSPKRPKKSKAMEKMTHKHASFYQIHHAPRTRRPVYYQLYLCILHSMVVPTDLCEY